jgi:uncharacterized protein YidB (DUF937 family)
MSSDSGRKRWPVWKMRSVQGFPGGSLGKPLMLALLALLASGALFRSGGPASATTQGSQPTSEGSGGLLGGLGGLLDKLQKGGLGDVANSWVGLVSSSSERPVRCASALMAPTRVVQAKLASQVLPGVLDKLTPAGRLPTLAELSNVE